MFGDLVLFLVVCGVAYGGIRWLMWNAALWRGSSPHVQDIQYLSAPMAVRPTIVGHRPPLGYRLASLYFGCGLVDRTRTLDHGFPVNVLDPLALVPAPRPDQLDTASSAESAVSTLSDLCLNRAEAILERGRKEDRPVRLLWSGGIDSTAAAAALLQTVDPKVDRLEFCYSKHSVSEYPLFFRESLRNQKTVKIKSVGDALGGDALIVTGEHGDQLFGSLKAVDIDWKELSRPWTDALPDALSKTLASPYRVEQVIDYIRPQVSAAPVPIGTLWDLLWWLNFSMKWQSVALRIPAIEANKRRASLDLQEQLHLTEHFFRSTPFQIWALNNRQHAIRPGDWNTYKWPLKEFVFTFNSDERFRNNKRKEASLTNVIQYPDLFSRRRRSIAFDVGGAVLVQPFDDTLRNAIDGTEEAAPGAAARNRHDRARESHLWISLGSAE